MYVGQSMTSLCMSRPSVICHFGTPSSCVKHLYPLCLLPVQYSSRYLAFSQTKYQRHLVGEIVTTLACDYVEFIVSGDVHGCRLEVTLVYTDLTTTLPSTVNITSKGMCL